MTDLEDAVKRLDNLTQEEARMALAEVLRITHSIRDKVQCVDERVQVVIDGARAMSNQSPIPSKYHTQWARRQAWRRRKQNQLSSRRQTA